MYNVPFTGNLTHDPKNSAAPRPAADNVVQLRPAKQTRAGFVAMEVAPGDTNGLRFLAGERAVFSRNENECIPSKEGAQPDFIYKCLTTNGDRIILVTRGRSIASTELLRLAEAPDDVRWVRIDNTTVGPSWYRMMPEAMEDTDDEDLESAG